MLPLKSRLITVRQQKNAHWETVELDYTLSLILVAIARNPLAAKSLVFKGGTALKKCYFDSLYRFSQDLDFTIDGDLDDPTIDQIITKIINQASNVASLCNNNIIFTEKRYIEQKIHPHGQLAYIIKARLPWHSQPLRKF